MIGSGAWPPACGPVPWLVFAHSCQPVWPSRHRTSGFRWLWRPRQGRRQPPASKQLWLAEPTAEEPSGPSVIESVTEFQQEFQKLLDSLEGVKAVVVFVDDLDRCLDETIIFVFEAIRLFLQVASTAFVLAANREIVQAAINRRYPASREGDPALGKDYLEKIIQIEVNVPPLTEAEAETYLNLLFAERRLDEAGMNSIRAAVDLRRRQGQFAVAMNYGIAKDALEADGGTVSPN